MKTWLRLVSIIAAGATALLTVAIAADKKAAPSSVPAPETSSPDKADAKAAAPATAPKKSEPAPSSKAANPQQPPAKPPVAAVMPDTNKMTLLIQSYMVALAQANITGRYDVLHAFGSPDFQSRNSPAQLEQNFQKLRENLDMSQIILYPPTLTSFPDMGPDGIVKVSGVYKMPPQPLQFAIAMQSVSGMWRLADIKVSNIVQSQVEAAPQPAQPAANAPAKTSAKTTKDAEPK